MLSLQYSQKHFTVVLQLLAGRGKDAPRIMNSISFKDTFGKTATRKRPRIAADDIAELVTQVAASRRRWVWDRCWSPGSKLWESAKG